jgi:hypothetical protein
MCARTTRGQYDKGRFYVMKKWGKHLVRTLFVGLLLLSIGLPALAAPYGYTDYKFALYQNQTDYSSIMDNVLGAKEASVYVGTVNTTGLNNYLFVVNVYAGNQPSKSGTVSSKLNVTTAYPGRKYDIAYNGTYRTDRVALCLDVGRDSSTLLNGYWRPDRQNS